MVPGAANVNLRGLGANRSLTLIDGHRAMPLNASMIVDLNTIPSIAIGGLEVITGGASAVYGADALAGVTNIKFRDNYEGMQLRFRGGLNEAGGDGEEHQISALIGANFADGRGNVMIGMEYSKRREALWRNRDHFREVMESPYSNSGSYFFAFDPYYSVGSVAGTANTFQGPNAWNGGPPSADAIAQVFANNTCPGGTIACIVNPTTCVPHGGNGFTFNPDGSLYVRSSQIVTGAGPTAVTTYYGPQGFNQPASATEEDGLKITCAFTQAGTSADPRYPGEPCNPTVNRIDWTKWLSGPREAYNMFARSTFDISENLEAYANFHVASSTTFTLREPAPMLGGSYVIIPFGTEAGGNIYMPSLNPATGATRPEYLAGGVKGLSCAPMGGCTMAEAFPVPDSMRTLLESRPGAGPIPSNGVNATNPFRGLDNCMVYELASAPAPGVLTNPESGALYTIKTDPNTGQPIAKCGAESGWALNQTAEWLPGRGTTNIGNLFQIAFGLRGDLGISDWTWDAYASVGTSETQTNYGGYQSLRNYMNILSAPNYGKGYQETGPASKYLTCTSGINPFDKNLVVSEDCKNAILTSPVDRNTMKQRILELTSQGHVMDLPAGEMRAAAGATYRWNGYKFQPDSLNDRNYTRDYSAGAFGSGDLNADVSVKEVYGELLIPLIKDMPFIRQLELELGARYSDYSTGQEVSTYKILGSWAPTEWLRLRGGYNRAERAPNMSELYATPNGTAQFAAVPTDPCRNEPNNALVNFPGPTPGTTLNNTDTTDPAFRAKLQGLCSAHMNSWGGNNATEFHADPNSWNLAGGSSLSRGNPNLRNEKGDTYTFGLAFASPFEHQLLSGITGTVDWYSASVKDPVEVLQTSIIINSCFNMNGLNPNFELDDPNGFCRLLERDPGTGAIQRVYVEFANQGKLQIRGVDVSARWTASMADLGLGMLPGSLSINTNMNFLLEQTQRYGVVGLADYAGFGGAAKFSSSTGFNYNWSNYRVGLTWNYRASTDSPTTFAAVPNANGTASPTLQKNGLQLGYPSVNMFNLSISARLGMLSVGFNVNNLFDKKPRPGGHNMYDPRGGFGSFSPFDDLTGRRYSFNVTADF